MKVPSEVASRQAGKPGNSKVGGLPQRKASWGKTEVSEREESLPLNPFVVEMQSLEKFSF